MLLDEKHAVNFVNKRAFPFTLAGCLIFPALIAMIIIDSKSQNIENVWLVGGTELLLYLLANAICSLIVFHYGAYIKKTILAYILNLGFMLFVIFLLCGREAFHYSDAFPIYSALVFCFFMSIVLTLIIRKVLEALKD